MAGDQGGTEAIQVSIPMSLQRNSITYPLLFTQIPKVLAVPNGGLDVGDNTPIFTVESAGYSSVNYVCKWPNFARGTYLNVTWVAFGV